MPVICYYSSSRHKRIKHSPPPLSGLKASCNPVAVSIGRAQKRAGADGDGITGGVLLIILELEAEGAFWKMRLILVENWFGEVRELYLFVWTVSRKDLIIRGSNVLPHIDWWVCETASSEQLRRKSRRFPHCFDRGSRIEDERVQVLYVRPTHMGNRKCHYGRETVFYLYYRGKQQRGRFWN